MMQLHCLLNRVPQSSGATKINDWLRARRFPMSSISRRHVIGLLGASALSPSLRLQEAAAQGPAMQSWPLGTAQRTGIHDLAPASDGGVWSPAQRSGHLGWFGPRTGRSELIALGAGP